MFFRPNIATLNIRLCFLVYIMLRPCFKDTLTKILQKKLNIFVIIYLNDILIYTKNLS